MTPLLCLLLNFKFFKHLLAQLLKSEQVSLTALCFGERLGLRCWPRWNTVWTRVSNYGRLPGGIWAMCIIFLHLLAKADPPVVEGPQLLVRTTGLVLLLRRFARTCALGRLLLHGASSLVVSLFLLVHYLRWWLDLLFEIRQLFFNILSHVIAIIVIH